MTFCPSCGAEKKEGSKFCHNCGYNFENAVSEAVQNDDFNTQVNPQVNANPNPNVQSSQNSHTISKVLGYIFAILIPIIGIVFGIYLVTREEEDAKKHGKIIIGLSVVIWIISYILMGM